MNHILKITIFASIAVIACAFTPGAARAEGGEVASEARVKAIASKLESAAGRKARITVVQDDRKEACVLPDGTIVITSGLLASCGSDSEVAFVIGHELSHFIAQDHSKKPPPSLVNSGVASETRADLYAVGLASAAGYNPVAGHRLLTRLSKDGGNDGANLGLRLEALETHFKSLKDRP